jgi:hypothetical protein
MRIAATWREEVVAMSSSPRVLLCAVALVLPLSVHCAGSESDDAELGGLSRGKADNGTDVTIDTSRARDVETWKPGIAAYSARHYGEDTWELTPIAIVLHYTAGTSFPWNLVESDSYSGEGPGLGCHFVAQEDRVWELLPDNVRGRCAYGANHRSVSIEMVAQDGSDLVRNRKQTMRNAAVVVTKLMKKHNIPITSIYSHEQIDTFDGSIPWVFDLVRGSGSGKVDPGEAAMEFMLAEVERLLASSGGSGGGGGSSPEAEEIPWTGERCEGTHSQWGCVDINAPAFKASACLDKVVAGFCSGPDNLLCCVGVDPNRVK